MYIVRLLYLDVSMAFETKVVKFNFLLKTSLGGSAMLPRRIHRSGNVQPRAAAVSGRRLGSVPQVETYP